MANSSINIDGVNNATIWAAVAWSRERLQDADEINITWAVPKVFLGPHYFHHWHLIQDDGGFPITSYKIDMLDIQTNNWLEITFIEGYAETKCSLSNILYGIMYRYKSQVKSDSLIQQTFV